MTEIRRTLETWLAAGTPAQQAHARWRLALLDDQPPTFVPETTSSAVAAASGSDPLLSNLGDWYPAVRACPSRSGCGCGGMSCSRLGRIVRLEECRACVESGNPIA